jgi:hypothetical protein
VWLLSWSFLLWLLGGLNPSQIHERLKQDVSFKNRFFEFFENIIHHHMPDIDIKVEANFEPRTQRPPLPPNPSFHPALDELTE